MERPGQQECSLTRLFLHLKLVYNTMFSVGDSLLGYLALTTAPSNFLFRDFSCGFVCNPHF